MKKGKLGISLAFYPVVAFLLAVFGQWLACLLVLGFAMAAEQDEWTTRQCMQAFFLSLVAMVTNVAAGFLMGLSSTVVAFSNFDLFGYPGAFTGVMSLLAQIVNAAVWVFVMVAGISGLLKAAKGREANAPIVSQWAYKAYGYLPRPAAPQQYGAYHGGQAYPPAAPPPAGYQPPAPQAPPPPPAPYQQQPQQPPVGPNFPPTQGG